ncbi:MAG TPA: tRNA (adenosine(37)-N6)-threonylcarbamoyltransferase complex dimerization subunit type 1 TsaB [Thermoguttaceae bacterium]
MKILALETTQAVGTVAAMDNANLLLELELNPAQRSAQSLVPGIRNLLKQVGWNPIDVQLVATTIGPGSFTGLRIGVTMAKTFAYATGADILGVNTLETIAQAAPDNISDLTAVIDAQRGELVARSFMRGSDGWMAPMGVEQLVSIDRWLQELPEGMVVTGPVLAKILPRLPEHVIVLDQQYWSPRAALVARLADRQYAAGRRDDFWRLTPHYSRRSAAEEKWESRGEG